MTPLNPAEPLAHLDALEAVGVLPPAARAAIRSLTAVVQLLNQWAAAADQPLRDAALAAGSHRALHAIYTACEALEAWARREPDFTIEHVELLTEIAVEMAVAACTAKRVHVHVAETLQ